MFDLIFFLFFWDKIRQCFSNYKLDVKELCFAQL